MRVSVGMCLVPSPEVLGVAFCDGGLRKRAGKGGKGWERVLACRRGVAFSYPQNRGGEGRFFLPAEQGRERALA